jgi:hypothetical protein
LNTTAIAGVDGLSSRRSKPRTAAAHVWVPPPCVTSAKALEVAAIGVGRLLFTGL